MKINITQGDQIEYQHIGDKRKPQPVKSGIVVQVTDSFITIEGRRYRDSILITDIDIGAVSIRKVRGKKVKPQQADWDKILPKVAGLIEFGVSINSLAHTYGVQSGELYSKLLNYQINGAKLEYARQRQEVNGVWGGSA